RCRAARAGAYVTAGSSTTAPLGLEWLAIVHDGLGYSPFMLGGVRSGQRGAGAPVTEEARAQSEYHRQEFARLREWDAVWKAVVDWRSEERRVGKGCWCWSRSLISKIGYA